MLKVPKWTLFAALLLLLPEPTWAAENGIDWGRERLVPGFMALAGAGIAIIWTLDLVSGDKVDWSEGVLLGRERENGQLIMPHLIAEYGTAVALLTGAYGQWAGASWGRDVSILALGALAYTAMNSLSWTLAEKERYGYSPPIIASLLGVGVSIVILF